MANPRAANRGPVTILLALVLAPALVSGCKAKAQSGSRASSASQRSDASAAPLDAGPLDSPAPREGGVRRMSNGMSTTILSPDAGSRSCKLLRPPLMQPYGGPAAIRLVRAGGTEIAGLIFNDAGHPQFSDAPLAVDRASPDVPMPPKTTLASCAVARDFIFCPDGAGAVHRTRGGAGEEDAVVAQARASTPIAAAPIGKGHVVLAFIDEVQTSEGLVRSAKVMLDDGPALPLSEDGSGATSIELAARGDDVVALMMDGRVAMTPVHARVLSVRNDKLEVGRDAVIFVGGPAERRTAGTLAIDAEGTTFALVAVSNATDQFGMAAVRLSDPPEDDEPVFWSVYPGGLDPAPIAATRGSSPIRVARARPTGPGTDASHVLEVGELNASGEFVAKCILSEAAYVKDVAIELDAKGAMWIFWRDTHGSHFERRAVP